MIGKWFLPLPFIFAHTNYTLTFGKIEKYGNSSSSPFWELYLFQIIHYSPNAI